MSSKVRPERRGYDKMIYEQHVDRLKKMAPTINSGPPHKRPNSDKWEQDKRREFLAIEYDNKLMLERLAKAIQGKGIDNKIHNSVKFHQEFKRKLAQQTKRERLAKLTRENKKLLRSIQEVAPAYNHIEWEESYKRNEHIKRTMALYPEYYERLDKEEAKKKELKMRQSMMTSQDYETLDDSPTKLPPIKMEKNTKKNSKHGH